MTLPSTPPLAFSQIKAEFNGSNSFRDYYAGGPYVPAGTTGVNGPIPSSGELRMSHFLGASNFLQQLTVTVGSSGGPFPLLGYSQGDEGGGGWGSLSNDNFFAGGHIAGFYWNTSDGNLFLVIDTDVSGSAFTTVTIDGHEFSSGAASFDGSAWTWSGVSNPFGTSGDKTVTFR